MSVVVRLRELRLPEGAMLLHSYTWLLILIFFTFIWSRSRRLLITSEIFDYLKTPLYLRILSLSAAGKNGNVVLPTLIPYRVDLSYPW